MNILVLGGTVKPTNGYISRKGVATFILDALEGGKYLKECITING